MYTILMFQRRCLDVRRDLLSARMYLLIYTPKNLKYKIVYIFKISSSRKRITTKFWWTVYQQANNIRWIPRKNVHRDTNRRTGENFRENWETPGLVNLAFLFLLVHNLLRTKNGQSTQNSCIDQNTLRLWQPLPKKTYTLFTYKTPK